MATAGSARKMFLLWWFITIIGLFHVTVGFVAQRRTSIDRRGAAVGSLSHCHVRTRQSCRFSSLNDDMDDGISSVRPKEKSKMPGYMASFLEKQKINKQAEDEPEASVEKSLYYTHMIGVPMEQCYDLLLQLESVQRAVIHHCPLLVESAVVGVMTRLPMLYVDGRHATKDTQDVTLELCQVVKRVVDKQINVKVEQQEEEQEIEPLDEKEFMRGPNADGYRPLVLTFEKLEIDGEDNEVLFTIAKEKDEATRLLRDFQNDIRLEIEALGYKTSLPPDETLAKQNDHKDMVWRPRIPFMRLPTDFQAQLPPIDEGNLFRKPEDGGNGISPIFWCQWWDDVFGMNTRLDEIGIYPRRLGSDDNGENLFDERTWYVPHETIALPKGNAALAQEEARHEAYQESRMKEMEKELTSKNEVGDETGDAIPDATVQEARKQLESLYEQGYLEKKPISDDGLVAEIPVAPEKEATAIDGENIGTDEDAQEGNEAAARDTPKVVDTPEASATASPKSEVNENDGLDDWTRERIRRAVEDRGSAKARKAASEPKKQPPPPMDENPVFQQYREARDKQRLVEEESKKESDSRTNDLPPFPAREHFVGAWNLVSSPIPSQLELNMGQEDATKSDNLLLRVDGTTFGGPVLDRENMHKAAGGTWKIWEEGEETRLRVRLVVPPSKERILFMEGHVKRLMMPSNFKTTRSSFGIPKVEEATKQAVDSSSAYDNVLQCNGEMWVQDARTGANRNDLGEFLLMKMDQSNPNDYIITIPRSVRNQD